VRALFLVPWPSDAASTRLRAEQYFPYLREQGVEPVLRPFMSPALYRMVYKRGHFGRKIGHVLRGSLGRLADVIGSRRADVVLVHREALPFGTTIVERAIAALGTPMVLDFDDAIYLPTSSEPNGFMRHLKAPSKVQGLLRASQAAIVGNRHLQRYALPFNARTLVIPTPVDTSVYYPRAERRTGDEIVIGWIGSGTTSHYLRLVAGPLVRLLERHPNVRLEVVGGASGELARLGLKGPNVRERQWSRSGELHILRGFDIGLMPYPDDEWARGKCAFKALLYMSVGIPAVCSAVGMAEEIVDHGQTGFLARSEDEWYAALETLVSNQRTRARVGAAGRDLVASEFSLERWAPCFFELLQSVASGRHVPIDELDTHAARLVPPA